MQHLDEGTIHAWLDGALSADEAARVELHVAACETCSDAVAEARGLIAASSRILTALDDVPRVPRARAGRGDRGAPRPFLVRWRIAAVVALVVGGGALALAVRRDSVPMVALEAKANQASEVALVALDSPAADIAEPSAPPNVDGTARVRANVVPGRGGVGAVGGGAPAQGTIREHDLSAPSADSAPPTLAQLDVRAAAAPPAAPLARTDDTARVPIDVATANRVTTDARGAEARSAATGKLGGVAEARRSGVEASARFAEPAMPQARLRAAAEPNAPRLLTEERISEQDGRVVVRRVYRVEETLVTLDERAPREREQQREQLEMLEERMSRVEQAAKAPQVDSATSPITTIRWIDSRGAELTLSGPVPREQLERYRRLLGY